MVNALTTLSVVALYVETLLIAYIAAQLYVKDYNVLILYAMIVVISYVLTSTSSSLMVRTSMDFSGRFPGRAVCFALHLCQLSLAWRFGKLVLLYDKKDWFELTSLRLVHIAIQTLPFLAVHGYITFSDMSTIHGVYILALAVALMSASISLTLFCVREQLHFCSWGGNDVTSGNSKRYFGMFLLLLGTTLALTARFACIILMCLVVQYLVFIPIALHMIILIFGYMSCKVIKSKSLALKDVLVMVGLSYLNIFDLVDRDINQVQCKYVSFYTVILVENIVMVAVWLMRSGVDYITKLVVMVIILLLFICALILKIASCGFISTACTAQLIQTETPDTATITEGKKIIEANTILPSISANVPHIESDIVIPNRQRQSESHGVVTKSKVSSHHRHHLPASVQVSESVTDHGTQESYSIDHPTHVSRYRSRDSSHIGARSSPQRKEKDPSNKARKRSEVSLDVCSSNSRNTNTVMTSVVEASNGSLPSLTKAYSNNNSKKIIFPLRSASSRWKRFNLRFPSVTNFLVRTHTFRPKPGPCENVEDAVAAWGDVDAHSSGTVSCEERLHKVMTSATEPQVPTKPVEGYECPAGHVLEAGKDTESLQGFVMSKEDRVQLWLADIKRSKPPQSCQCSSESHSSDFTYVVPPRRHCKIPAGATGQDVPKFEEFLADVPNHPEISFVISSKQEACLKHQPVKFKSLNPLPILNTHKRLSVKVNTQEPQPGAKMRLTPNEQHRPKISYDRVCLKDFPEDYKYMRTSQSEDISQPQSALSTHRSESGTQIDVSETHPYHQRAVSETPPAATPSQDTRSSHCTEPSTFPYIIKLGAMESLV